VVEENEVHRALHFLSYRSKKEHASERGHGLRRGPFFYTDHLEVPVFTQATFPAAEANAALGPRFQVGALIPTMRFDQM
jgi:hypothetical protein